jgi:hypothetical protein
MEVFMFIEGFVESDFLEDLARIGISFDVIWECRTYEEAAEKGWDKDSCPVDWETPGECTTCIVRIFINKDIANFLMPLAKIELNRVDALPILVTSKNDILRKYAIRKLKEEKI